MKIENVKTRQQIVIPSSYPHCLDERDIETEKEEQNSGIEIINQDISLREQILAIQKTKALLGISNQAATDTSMPRWHKFYYLECDLIKETYRTVWGDASGIGSIVRQMRDLASSLNDNEMKQFAQFMTGGKIRKVAGKQVTLGPFIESNTGLISLINGKFNPSWVLAAHQLSEQTIVNAATTLRYILEKGGDGLKDYDEAGLIKMLLTSRLKDVRKQGAIAARNAYRHKWRKNISGTGLILALKNEKDASVRAQVAYAIAYADPVSIFKEHTAEYASRKFCPMSRLFEDSSIDVRIALSLGVGNVLIAQEKRGKYYEDFSEIPVISAQNRIDALQCATNSLEELINKDDLSEDEKILLLNITLIVSELVGDNSVNAFNQCCTTLEDQTINGLLLKLAEINLKRLIRVTTHTKFSDPEQQDFNIWNNSSFILIRILFDLRTIDPNPLKTHFLLKEDIRKMKAGTRDPFINSNLEGALLVIDNSIEGNILVMGTQNIKWGNVSDFNFIAANLVDLLITSQSASCKLAVLNTFDNLCQNGLQLDKKGQVTIDAALTESNGLALRQSLRQVVSSEPPSRELILAPTPTTPQGKAILIHRKVTTSFKDYFGMTDLKERVLDITLQ